MCLYFWTRIPVLVAIIIIPLGLVASICIAVYVAKRKLKKHEAAVDDPTAENPPAAECGPVLAILGVVWRYFGTDYLSTKLFSQS